MEDTNDDGRYSEEVKLREETYQRKLQENIELKQAFYDNGVRNYNDFKSSKELEESDDDEIINLKRETIALYDSLKKLAFRPERDDLIGISLADYKLDKQVKGLKKETDGIKNYNASLLNRINCTSALIKNFESIGESLDLRITKEELKTTQVNDISVKFKIKDLEKKISIQKQRELQLMKYSKQVIYKYLIELNFSDLNDDTIKNKTILKKKNFTLIETLLNKMTINIMNKDNKIILDSGNSLDGYIKVEDKNDPLLRQLLKGDLIIEKGNLEYIKLRSFGLEFNSLE